jgi:hypothetical protein
MPVLKVLLGLRLAMSFLFRYSSLVDTIHRGETSCPTLPLSQGEVNGVIGSERLTDNVLWKAGVEGLEAKTAERFW